MRIGKLIRNNLIGTRAPWHFRDKLLLDQVSSDPNSRKVLCSGQFCYCASSCFLIWSAGISRDGQALIVHRPRDVTGTFGLKSPADAQSTYKLYLDEMSTYLGSMDVPPKYIQMMIETPSNDGRLLDPDDVDHNLAGYPMSIQEWLLANCEMLTSTEKDEESQLSLQQYRNAISSLSVKRLLMLDDKRNVSSACVAKKILAAREKLH